MRVVVGLALAAAACGEPLESDHDGAPPADEQPGEQLPPPPDPILFVHGINGSADDWAVMLDRFRAAGWADTQLLARTFDDPSWGCNTDNADTIGAWVDELLAATGAERVDVVAHSMGGLSSRWFMKELQGTARTGTYVTLGTMHQGLTPPCWSPLDVCVWQELCESGAFIAALEEAPVTPGPAAWVSIYSDGDDTVPMARSELLGAENLMLPGIEHAGEQGLQQSPVVFDEVLRVLAYD